MNFVRTYWFPVAVLVTAALKLALCAGMPLCIHAGAVYDDAWAVRAAEAIADGRWLGAYDDVTLVKNVGFPLWLALCIKLGCGYLVPTAALYVLATMLFTAALRPLVNSRALLFALYMLVLFCPVSFAVDTYQRVYRNSITAAQVLLVFGSYLGMYLRVRVPRGGRVRLRAVVPWALAGAVSLAWFWTTREDSIWVAPFVLVASGVIVVALGRRALRGHMALAGLACGIVLALVPLFATGAAVQGVKTANEARYGVATAAELNSGAFARMVKDLYAIDPARVGSAADPSDAAAVLAVGGMPENLRVACTHACLLQAYEASPTLAGMRGQVEAQLLGWGDAIDNDPGDGEVNGGEFAWVLRRAARDAGAYASAPAAEAFYARIADELEAAFARGRLPERATMPSSIMTPWRAEYASELSGALAGICAQAVAYGDVTALPFSAQGSAEGVAWFERVTGNAGWHAGQPVLLACVVGEGIVWLYRVLGPLLALAGAACALLLCVRLARRARRARVAAAGTAAPAAAADRTGPLVLVLAALALSVFALAAGLAYSRVSAFVPISYYYYGSAAYPLLVAFNVLAVAGVLEAHADTHEEAA